MPPDDRKTHTYLFVQYLSEKNLLDEIVSLYMNRETKWEAEYIRYAAWLELSGQEYADFEKTAFRHIYRRLQGDALYGFALAVLKEHAWVYLGHCEYGLTPETALHYAYFQNDGIRFVKDFFIFDHPRPLEVTLIPRYTLENRPWLPTAAGGIPFGQIVDHPGYTLIIHRYNDFDSPMLIFPLFIGVHEAGHVLFREMGMNPVFPRDVPPRIARLGFRTTAPPRPVEEYICAVLELLYLAEIYERGNICDATRLAIRRFFGRYGNGEHFEYITTENVKRTFHLMAANLPCLYEPRLPYYNFSLLFFLMENSTPEEFTYAIRNDRNMETVFGRDMAGMVEEWHEFLRGLTP